MKILLTGGAGFIGSHILEMYLSKGHDVVVLDNFSTPHPIEPPENVTLIRQDLKTCNLEAIFNEHKFDVINHHAAQVNVRLSITDPILDARENIITTLRLLQTAILNDHPIKKFIFASSGGAIYGMQNEYPSSEDAPRKPESPYGLSKLAAENYIEFFRKTYDLKTVVLRYANVYGPRQDPRGEAGVVSIFAERYLNNEPPTIYGDGAQTRDFVYVKDVARANLAVVEDDVEGIFNIGTGVETTVNEISDNIKAIIKSSVDAKNGPSVPGELVRSSVAIDKAQNEFNWQPLTNLKSGLAETITFLKEQLALNNK